MDITCQLHLYDLKKCGLYESRSDPAKHMGISELLRSLKDWAIDSQKALIETSTYNSNSSYLEAYCLGVEEYNGNFLVALWNKIPSSKSGVGVVNGTNPPLKAKVKIKSTNDEDIPGYPSYFWVLPNAGIIAAIKITNPNFGISQFRGYLTGYLHCFTPHSVFRKGDLEIVENIVGYVDDPANRNDIGDDGEPVINSKLFPYFSMPVKKVPGRYDEMKNRSSEITKIVKDIYVHNNLSREDQNQIEKIVSFFNNISPVRKKKLRLQVPVELTSEQVQEYIDKYEDSDHSNEHDVGFIFKHNNGKIEWLRGANQTEEVTIKVDFIGPDQPDLGKLAASLDKFKHRLK